VPNGRHANEARNSVRKLVARAPGVGDVARELEMESGVVCRGGFTGDLRNNRNVSIMKRKTERETYEDDAL
jgi:hypothetical protein